MVLVNYNNPAVNSPLLMNYSQILLYHLHHIDFAAIESQELYLTILIYI